MTTKDNDDPQGLIVGSKAPLIKIKDVNGEMFDLEHALKSHSGVLIDLFRATF